MVESEEDYLRRNKNYQETKESLGKELEALREEHKKYAKEASRIGKEMVRITKKISALNEENKALNRERIEGIRRAKANRANKNMYVWYTVGFKKKDTWISCGEDYYQTEEECLSELDWFKTMFPEREFGIKHVIRDEVNQENIKAKKEKGKKEIR